MIIATYNVEFLFDEGEHRHSGQTWTYQPEYVAERVQKLAEKFKEINADLLLLQEVGSQSVVQKIVEKSGISYQRFYGETDRFGVGNVVLYRIPVSQVSSISTTGSLPAFGQDGADSLSPNIPSRRGFVYITIDYRGNPLHVIGQHLKANFLVDANGEGVMGLLDTQSDAADALIRSEMFRMSQAKKLRETIDGIFADDGQAQIVVAGDFNAEGTDTVQRIIRGAQDNEPNVLWSAVAGIDEAKRYTEVSPNGTKHQIDDLLCSASLRQHVSNVSILNDALTSHKNIAPYPAFTDSDHAPIVMVLA